MKKLFTLIYLLVLAYSGYSQHDPALDSINGGMANLDADVNGYISQQLTLNQLQTNSAFVYSNLQTGLGSYTSLLSSNSSGMQTNFSAWVTNFSAPFSSNFIGNYDWNATNSHYSTNFGTITAGPFWAGGNTITYNLSIATLLNVTTVGNIVSNIVLAIVWMIHFWKIMDFMKVEIYGTMNQKQVSGSSQSIMGTNFEFLWGVTYALAITAALATVLGAIATNSFISGPSGLSNTFHSLTNSANTTLNLLPAWDVMTYFFPATQILGAWISYNVFRFFLIWPLFATVRMMIFWFIK